MFTDFGQCIGCEDLDYRNADHRCRVCELMDGPSRDWDESDMYLTSEMMDEMDEAVYTW